MRGDHRLAAVSMAGFLAFIALSPVHAAVGKANGAAAAKPADAAASSAVPGKVSPYAQAGRQHAQEPSSVRVSPLTQHRPRRPAHRGQQP